MQVLLFLCNRASSRKELHLEAMDPDAVAGTLGCGKTRLAEFAKGADIVLELLQTSNKSRYWFAIGWREGKDPKSVLAIPDIISGKFHQSYRYIFSKKASP
jgi:hypothetical protein